MKCPRCNRPIQRAPDPAGGGVVLFCGACGWGRSSDTADRGFDDEDDAASHAPSWIMILLGWAGSIAIVVGPYVALLYYMPQVEAWMHYTYWAVMFTYLLSAAALDPQPDMSNLGWGGTMINNPFTYEDNINRKLLGLAMLLLPGKLVAWTLVMTWRRCFGSHSRR